MSGDDTPGSSLAWRVHDLVMGLLSGTGAGLVAGVFLVTQATDNIAVIVIAVGVGAAIGLTLLVRFGRARDGVTVARVVAWVVFLLTASFMYLLIDAIRSFE